MCNTLFIDNIPVIGFQFKGTVKGVKGFQGFLEDQAGVGFCRPGPGTERLDLKSLVKGPYRLQVPSEMREGDTLVVPDPGIAGIFLKNAVEHDYGIVEFFKIDERDAFPHRGLGPFRV